MAYVLLCLKTNRAGIEVAKTVDLVWIGNSSEHISGRVFLKQEKRSPQIDF